MTKVKGRLAEWIEAKVRALSESNLEAVVPDEVEKGPSHIRVRERGSRAVDRHGNSRRPIDGRGHRSSIRR